MPPGLLAKWAAHSSEREEAAAEAERALVEIKKFRLLDEQLSTRLVIDYDAVVSKCMPFGCFVEIPELAVSGLVHVSLLFGGISSLLPPAVSDFVTQAGMMALVWLFLLLLYRKGVFLRV